MPLHRRDHWIFDLDGTLTVGIHDFDAIRRELGLPRGRAILETLASMEERAARPLRERLAAIEADLARRATAAIGAAELLADLTSRRVRLGILTRNSRANALVTLEAAGLLPHFDLDFVVTRDEAAPKPDPAGVLRLLRLWEAPPSRTVMVGDYRYDLEAGRAAGAATAYVDPTGTFLFRELADHVAESLVQLRDVIVAGETAGESRG